MQIKDGKAVKTSNCKTASRSIDTGVKGSSQGLTVENNGHLYKVSGITKDTHPIAVVNKKTGKKDLYKLKEKIAEPEQISIDGNTGEVYLVYNHGHKGVGGSKARSHTYFIRVDSSVFKKYTGKSKTTDTPTCKGYNKPVANKHSAKKSSSDDTPNNSQNDDNPSDDSSTNPSNNNKTLDNSSSDQDQSQKNGNNCTILFGCFEDDGDGCGVFMILNLILDILTFGVAIAAIIGIAISGVIYLTASGNEQQTTKAKRRLFEIVIGLVVYAILFAALSFLLPGGKLNSSGACKKVSSSIPESSSQQLNQSS